MCYNNKGGSGGGGGSRRSGLPLFDHDIGFLTLRPKLDPLLDPPFLLVDLRWTLNNMDGIGLYSISTDNWFNERRGPI